MKKKWEKSKDVTISGIKKTYQTIPFLPFLELYIDHTFDEIANFKLDKFFSSIWLPNFEDP